MASGRCVCVLPGSVGPEAGRLAQAYHWPTLASHGFAGKGMHTGGSSGQLQCSECGSGHTVNAAAGQPIEQLAWPEFKMAPNAGRRQPLPKSLPEILHVTGTFFCGIVAKVTQCLTPMSITSLRTKFSSNEGLGVLANVRGLTMNLERNHKNSLFHLRSGISASINEGKEAGRVQG